MSHQANTNLINPQVIVDVKITLTTGEDPVLASHRMRQESSPTLQNSCALHNIDIF